MNVKITPNRLCGEVTAVPSKSDFIRKLLCASLADGQTIIKLSGVCEDARAAIEAVKSIGANVKETNGAVEVSPIKKCADKINIHCGESAATARFLLPISATLGAQFTMTGSGTLLKRPFAELTSLMRQNGCEISSDFLPLECKGKLCGNIFLIRGDISSQYISGLLMALPLIGGGEIKLATPLQSRGYVRMTADTMKLFGVAIEETSDGFFVGIGQKYKSPGEISVEGDWSNALWLMAAAAIDGDILIKGLSLASHQPDRAAAEIMKSAGAKIEADGDAVRVRKSKLKAISADVSQCPDSFPVLAAFASAANGKSKLCNAARLRYKESDRLMSVQKALSAIGADIVENGDSVEIFGKAKLSGGVSDSFCDHRIVMCLASAASACTGDVTINNAQAISKSYPTFFDDFKSLGGIVNVI